MKTFTNRQTRVLLALVRARPGHRSYDDVMAATGLSRSTVHTCLNALESEGLVTQEYGKSGTLRPLVEVVR